MCIGVGSGKQKVKWNPYIQRDSSLTVLGACEHVQRVKHNYFLSY